MPRDNWALTTTRKSIGHMERSCMMQWRSCVPQPRPNTAKQIMFSKKNVWHWKERRLYFTLFTFQTTQPLRASNYFIWASVVTGDSVLKKKTIYAMLVSVGHLLRRFSWVTSDAVFVWMPHCLEWAVWHLKHKSVKCVEKEKPSEIKGKYSLMRRSSLKVKKQKISRGEKWLYFREQRDLVSTLSIFNIKITKYYSKQGSDYSY